MAGTAALVACSGHQDPAPVPSSTAPAPSSVAPAVPSSPPVVSVVEQPRLELGESEVGFFVYGEGGDDKTAAVAGVRVAVIEDPEAWWKALREDAPDAMAGLPPGYRVEFDPVRLESAPARIVTTAADGTAVAPRGAGHWYLFCVLSTESPGVVAGCTERLHYLHRYPLGFRIYLSRGSAYFMDHDGYDRASHYEQYQQRGGWSRDPVEAVFVSRVFLDFSDDEFPEGWYFIERGVFAVVADSDIDDWWRAMSQDGALAISMEDDHNEVTISEWGSSNRFTAVFEVRGDIFEAAPATYVSVGAGGAGTTMLAPGDYLFCVVGP